MSTHTSRRTFIGSAQLLLVLGCWIGGCSEPSAVLPDEMFGEWRTRERGYADRYLAIDREGVLRIGLGEAGEQVVRIEHIAELDASGRERQFVLGYVDPDGLPSELPLTFVVARESLFVGGNRDAVWTRAEPAR